MMDFLTNHALRNVWCTPDQDYQYIWQPARLTPRRGAERQFNVEWQTLALPDNTHTYHVYQIGQIDPHLLGMDMQQSQWVNLATLCTRESLIVDLYLNDGVQFPRFTSYARYMGDRNLVLAVRDQPLIADLSQHTLYFRVYSNAYFMSDRADLNFDQVVVDGIVGETPEKILLFQRRLREYRLRRGVAYCFRNGRLVDDVPPNRVEIGDMLELVYDSTVDHVVEFPIAELRTFDSLLDKKRKYLLHPSTKQDVIWYRDDVDVFLTQRNGEQYGGVYVHKNQEDALRMVTHQDYSIPVAYLSGYVQDHPDWSNLLDLTVRLHVRRSGYHRPLVYEHHRIQELYKLDDADILDAMLGIDSTVSVWRADVLEASDYPRIMRSLRRQVTSKMVQSAYGYNAMAKLVADTPQYTRPEMGRTVVDLPYGLRQKSTIFEYDTNGHLLGFYYHSDGGQYIARQTHCAMIEGIVGQGSQVLTTVYGDLIVGIDPQHNYRMYVCDVVGYEPNHDWRDVTGSDLYSIVNNEVVWHIDPDRYYPAVKNDIDFLAYTYIVPVDQGVIRFSVTAKEHRGDSFAALPLEIPVGRLELWLNRRPLIENLDYIVRWPEVVICNKEYLVDGDQYITIRGSGFCNADMTREPAPDVGFVEHGLLSRNNRFDIRDDKVMRVVVDGALRHPKELSYSEAHSTPVLADVRNGAPYVVRDLIVPLRGLTEENTYTLRDRSRVVDQEISDYLTLKHPEAVITDPNVIPELYQIFSPFISKIHHDLATGLFYPDGIEGQYSEMDLREWLQEYEFLLDYDPALNGVDLRYVSVHPHNQYVVTELNIYQYTLLERAIKAYLNDAVDLTAFVRIKEGWI